MKRNAMSLKAIISNIAKENKVSAQSVLQTYMLERLLERISVSEYKNNFILKGGMLISAMLGIDSRTTMDMDTTIKGISLTEEKLNKIINEICSLDLDDSVIFKIKEIAPIREDDDYGGYRVTFEATYDNMAVVLKIDITTGDEITFREIKYSFSLLLENRKIQIWSYNIETIIAEKYEAIIKRGVLGTRIRDFYDIYMLYNTQSENIDKNTLKAAILKTSKHRKTLDIINNWREVIEILRDDESMKNQWRKYKKNNFYADGIEYADLISALERIGEIYGDRFKH